MGGGVSTDRRGEHSFGEALARVGLLFGEMFIPYHGDKLAHRIGNEGRRINPNNHLVTYLEACFYVAKYSAFVSAAIDIADRII